MFTFSRLEDGFVDDARVMAVSSSDENRSETTVTKSWPDERKSHVLIAWCDLNVSGHRYVGHAIDPSNNTGPAWRLPNHRQVNK